MNNINIPIEDKLHKQVKLKAMELELTMKDAVTRALQEFVRRD